MNAQEILAEVEKFGATLVVLDGKLKATPPGVLPSDLKAAIRERAPEIKAALLTVPPPDAPEVPDAGRAAWTRDTVPESRHPLIPPEVRAKIGAVEAERVARLDERYERERCIGRAYEIDPTARIPENSPARALIRLCREFGVELKLEPDGMVLAVRPWRSLLTALEAHVDEVALLLAAEWNGDDA
jgi:hypothetical protein